MQSASAPLSELFEGRRLTPVQRRIALHIMERGPEVAFSSSIEVAEQVGVSQPSVTRLATALGYEGFGDLQRAIQTMVLRRAETGWDEDENKMQRAVQHGIESLLALKQQLGDLSAIEDAARALADSPVLLVHGSRSGVPLARQFEFFAAKIHPHVRYLGGSRTELLDQLSQSRDLGATAMLVVALPRHPRELVELLRAAADVGLEIVLLADSPVSDVAQYGTYVLCAPVNSDLVFDAAVAPLQLLTVLLEAVADASPARARKRLERFESLAADQRYFLD